MPTRNAPSSPRTRRRQWLRLAIGGTAAVALTTAVNAAPASAALVPPPGPWPVAISGATNPLTGSPAILNGAQATGNARLRVWLPSRGRKRVALTRVIGGRTVVRGHLRNPDTRRSISGALVTLVAQNVYSGDWAAVGHVPTNRKGIFRGVLPPGGHRRVAVLYWPSVTSTSPVFSRRLLVRASGRVYLGRPVRTKPRLFRFGGKVSGAPIPARGLLVALQVRNRLGNWVTARIASTTPSGRYRIRYRFSPGRLTVRIRVPAQTAWPLFGGQSAPRHIQVR